MELKNVSFQRIYEAGIVDLFQLSQAAGIQDGELLTDSEDIRERLILIKRKLEGSSHTWKHFFTSMRKEKDLKIDTLVNIMNTVDTTFRTIPTDSLSEILWQEGHLQQPDLLGELASRIRNLKERKSLVIIAGETNGGKSTFLNLLLGEDILPTDILHCTFSICRIEYSEAYSVKTLNHDGEEEWFPCITLEEAKLILKAKVSQQEMKERQFGASVKEITVGLPADILKSGVTLVDTPGIGEDEAMDDVTMNFVKSTHASAFIYIIKSDTAGGVQEDRLLSFLRAIKEKYQSDALCEAFDPRAAIFVCHRWDNIEEDEKEKVKKNALTRLEYVWPGFQESQTFFFSTKSTLKHLPVDPAFVPDSYYELLKGLKELFDRASSNAIKHQYIWLKYMLQPAARHLKSMITHCIRSNEELEKYFKTVAVKQEKLMISSKEDSRKLQLLLDTMSDDLLEKIKLFLNFDTISPRMEVDDFDDLQEICAQENYLSSKENRYDMDERIVRSLLTYTDEHVHAMQLVQNLEQRMLQEIQKHLGLFKSQIHQIKHDMLHGDSHVSTPTSHRRNLSMSDLDSSRLGASTSSLASNTSHSSMEAALQEDWTMDPINLATTVKGLLVKRKKGTTRAKSGLNGKYEMRQTLFGKLKDKIVYGNRVDPVAYLEERIQKIARKMREDPEILDSIIQGYTGWIQEYVNHATRSIPQFLDVNTKLMDVIREHRGSFQRDKDLLLKVMEDLEPCRHHLSGYGELFMADINANMLTFSIQQSHSSVYLPRDIVASYRKNDDSGFHGSGSKKSKVKSLWGRMQGAVIKIDDQEERIVVKSYIYDTDEQLLLSEIASLRCLDDKNIAPFFGMTRIKSGSTRGASSVPESEDMPEEKISAFIFRGDLISARVHSRRKMTNMQLFVPDLIHGLLKGLNYIHRERLVHMELNLDTVMVEKSTGTVKLCQMCKPREARFPANMDTQTRNCVYLSPSVLQGQMYENTDDLYAFGLLLWECLFPKDPPFKEERLWPLKKFIDECHPSAMLSPELTNLKVSEEVMEVLKGVLLVSRRTICMPIASAQSYLANISEEPAVLNLRSRPPSYPFKDGIRRNSSETPLVEITSASGKRVNFLDDENPGPQPAVSEKVPSSPVPPPRRKNKNKKGKLNGKSNSFDDHETQTTPIVMPKEARHGRRQSEPVVMAPPMPLLTSKPKRPFGFITGLFKSNNHPKRHSLDESNMLNNTGHKSHFWHSKKHKKRISVDSAIGSQSSMHQYEGIGGKPAKVLGLNSTPRRLSLQEPALQVQRFHSQSSLDSGDAFDVPEKLLNGEFSSPLEGSTRSFGQGLLGSSAYSGMTARDIVTGSMPSLLQCDDDNSPTHMCRSHRSSREFSPPGSASNSPRHHRKHFFEDNQSRKMRLSSDRRHSISLFQTNVDQLSSDTVDHTSHAIGPIIETNTETSQPDEQENCSRDELKRLRSQAWRRGSLDMNIDRKIQPIVPEPVSPIESKSLARKISPLAKPTIVVQEEKPQTVPEKSPTLSTASPRDKSTPKKNISEGDLSSSTASQSGDSGFQTDVSGKSVPRQTNLPSGLHSDMSIAADLWGSSSEKFLELPKIAHVRSNSAPLEIDTRSSRSSCWDDDAQSAEVLLAISSRGFSLGSEINIQSEDDNNGNVDPSATPTRDYILGTQTDIQSQYDINDNVTTTTTPIPARQLDDVVTISGNKSNMPPPPPPLDFSLLTFSDVPDDDNYADEMLSL